MGSSNEAAAPMMPQDAEVSSGKSKIAFVTRKALVTFGPHNPIAILHAGSVCFVQVAVIEYPHFADDRHEIPRSFDIVALPDGKKLTKRVHVLMGSYSVPYAMVELDQDDLASI